MVLTIDGLSEQSILKAQRQVEQFRKKFVEKNRQFVRELLHAGITVAQDSMGQHEGDSELPVPNSPHVFMGVREGIMTATLRLQGKDVMFVEFGAGVHFNGPAGQSPNPLGVKLGYTIGSYGRGNGANDSWTYKRNGEEITSYGTKATMPLYNADMEIRQKFAEIARRVFGG